MYIHKHHQWTGHNQSKGWIVGYTVWWPSAGLRNRTSGEGEAWPEPVKDARACTELETSQSQSIRKEGSEAGVSRGGYGIEQKNSQYLLPKQKKIWASLSLSLVFFPFEGPSQGASIWEGVAELKHTCHLPFSWSCPVPHLPWGQVFLLVISEGWSLRENSRHADFWVWEVFSMPRN